MSKVLFTHEGNTYWYDYCDDYTRRRNDGRVAEWAVAESQVYHKSFYSGRWLLAIPNVQAAYKAYLIRLITDE